MSLKIKEVQQLLVNLGKIIKVDGIWGPKSQAAMDAALKETSTPTFDELIVTALPDSWWNDIKWFKRDEFRCPCGNCGGYPAEPQEKLVRIADSVREHFNSPMTVSSGVRCKRHNSSLQGSVANSRHLEGKAMDFCVRGMSSTMVKVYLDQLVKQGKLRYCYCIDSSFVHMDIL